MDCNRHVCLKDLENYLKKNQYLEGYTPVEQFLIRENIGAVGLDDLLGYVKSECIEITYDELQELIKNKELNTRYVYAITDFLSIYLSNVKISDGIYLTWGSSINPSKTFKIFTIALTPDTLCNRVILYSEDYPSAYKWIVEYDCTQEILTDGTKTKGKITYLKDYNNNIAYYDFKNIKSRITREQYSDLGTDYLDLYTFNTYDLKEASESPNVYNNHFQVKTKNNIFIGDLFFNNKFEEGFINNIFTSSCYNSKFKPNTSNNIFKLPIVYLTGNFRGLIIENNEDISKELDKLISKVEGGYAISYLDPDTLTLLMYKL